LPTYGLEAGVELPMAWRSAPPGLASGCRRPLRNGIATRRIASYCDNPLPHWARSSGGAIHEHLLIVEWRIGIAVGLATMRVLRRMPIGVPSPLTDI
jgi:hypothetical protein